MPGRFPPPTFMVYVSNFSSDIVPIFFYIFIPLTDHDSSLDSLDLSGKIDS